MSGGAFRSAFVEPSWVNEIVALLPCPPRVGFSCDARWLSACAAARAITAGILPALCCDALGVPRSVARLVAFRSGCACPTRRRVAYWAFRRRSRLRSARRVGRSRGSQAGRDSARHEARDTGLLGKPQSTVRRWRAHSQILSACSGSFVCCRLHLSSCFAEVDLSPTRACDRSTHT